MSSPIDRAIEAAGGLSALAKRLGVRPQVVSNWRRRRVPSERVIDVEAACGAVVTRRELRPDVFARPEGVSAHA